MHETYTHWHYSYSSDTVTFREFIKGLGLLRWPPNAAQVVISTCKPVTFIGTAARRGCWGAGSCGGVGSSGSQYLDGA